MAMNYLGIKYWVWEAENCINRNEVIKTWSMWIRVWQRRDMLYISTSDNVEIRRLIRLKRKNKHSNGKYLSPDDNWNTFYHQVPTRRPDLLLIHKKKKTCHLVDFAVSTDLRMKMKDSKQTNTCIFPRTGKNCGTWR